MNEDRIGRLEIALLHTVPLIPLINTEARQPQNKERRKYRIKKEKDSVH